MGLDTRGAHSQSFGASIDPGAHMLEVRQPTATCQVVGVTNVIPADGLLSAYITDFCHAAFLMKKWTARI